MNYSSIYSKIAYKIRKKKQSLNIPSKKEPANEEAPAEETEPTNESAPEPSTNEQPEKDDEITTDS